MFTKALKITGLVVLGLIVANILLNGPADNPIDSIIYFFFAPVNESGENRFIYLLVFAGALWLLGFAFKKAVHNFKSAIGGGGGGGKAH